jgi:hypothetical protein
MVFREFFIRVGSFFADSITHNESRINRIGGQCIIMKMNCDDIMKHLTNGFHSRYEKMKCFMEISGINLTGFTEKYMRIKPLRLIAWWFLITGAFAVLVIAAPASDEESSKIGLESSIYYTVKKGDTLWDISNRYFNTHWRWPQIWSENQQIMNPHRIFPGERLRLYHQAWDASVDSESPDHPLAVVESRYYVYSFIQRIGFVKEEPIASSGQVALIKGDKDVQKTLLAQDESIYVTPSGNTSLKVGDVYAVYRPPMPVKDIETKNLVGFQYYMTGLVRIVESREDFVIAKIEKAFRSIMVDDIILPYEPRSPKIRMIPGKDDIDGKILKGEENIELFGDSAVAFINKGTEDGIQVGQTYAVYEEYSTDAMSDKVDFGSLLILHAESTNATVLITRSDRTIRADVKFRSASSSQHL